jgi:thiamine biosynthesis lipoprotein
MIDLDGIAQGYTVDLLSNFLIEKGVKHFIVELGGEIRTSGSKPDGSLWSVGIEGPMDNAQQGTIIDRELTISGKAITTSGSYRKFIMIGDRYFSHIINPKTGYPSNNGLISVTVIANDAITADALDNSFMVMGLKKTFRLLHTMPDIGVYMVYKKANGSIADTSNSVFKNYINSTY